MARYLLYSHDSYGLGHFRRSSLIAAGLVGASEANEVLIVTGSPRAQAFSLPDRVDTVKLPTATKDAVGSYRPRKLSCGIDRLVRLRSTLISGTAAAFEPDVILIDHAPLGLAGELRPLLERLSRLQSRPRLVLGLRDIVDDADRVDASWRRDAIWQALDRFDDVLVYGDPRVTTTARELDLDARLGATVTHTGYVAPVAAEELVTDPFVLVTAGGGGDGHQLLRRYLDSAENGQRSRIRSVVVTGPLLAPRRRAELMSRAAGLPSVELLEFSTDMRSLIASATGVISMAGYNTVVEELRAGVPTMLVPRSTPRLEQHLRAERLATVTHLEHTALEALTPTIIDRFVDRCQTTARTSAGVDLEGVNAVVNLLDHTNAGQVADVREPAHV